MKIRDMLLLWLVILVLVIAVAFVWTMWDQGPPGTYIVSGRLVSLEYAFDSNGRETGLFQVGLGDLTVNGCGYGDKSCRRNTPFGYLYLETIPDGLGLGSILTYKCELGPYAIPRPPVCKLVGFEP